MVRLQKEDFDIGQEIEKIKKFSRKTGAIVSFLGVAREFSKGKEIENLEFEIYQGMAETKLQELRQMTMEQFNILELKIIHRYGKIDINENIVLIIASAEHRSEAFSACRFCIDELKKIVPIWKKEMTTEGEVWVEEHP